MNLGSKVLNDLISKDAREARAAAERIVAGCDVISFQKLIEKQDFIFDFLKDKIIKNLTAAVNSSNVLSLFCFMGFYSDIFSDFIINSLTKFKTTEIIEKMISLFETGTPFEKTYCAEFFKKVKDDRAKFFANQNINAGFEPLKTACIKLLAEYNDKLEYYKKLEILKNSNDEYEKMEAALFLSIYAESAAFEPVYSYFLNSGENYLVASNLLLIKNFETLIKEDNESAILKLYSSLLYNFPENVTFSEINFYLNEGVFEYLLDTPGDFPCLLNFHMMYKLDLILGNEAYSIDLSKEDKYEAKILREKIKLVTCGLNLAETVANCIKSSYKTEILLALETILFEENFSFSDELKKEIENLCRKTEDNEILLKGLDVLRLKSVLGANFAKEMELKVPNPIVKEEIKRFYASIS